MAPCYTEAGARWKSEYTYDGRQRLRRRLDYTWNTQYSQWQVSAETRYLYVGMLLTVEAPYGREVTAEASSDLATWSAIATDPCGTGEFEVYAEGAKALGQRFYRAWQAGP